MAETTELAHRAAREGVKITYKNRRKPVLDIEDALVSTSDDKEAFTKGTYCSYSTLFTVLVPVLRYSV